MGRARKFSSETPLKKLNWSTTIGFSFKTLCIWPAQNPEKSRDFIFKNPGIFINLKSRDPGIPGIPLRPAHQVGQLGREEAGALGLANIVNCLS